MSSIFPASDAKPYKTILDVAVGVSHSPDGKLDMRAVVRDPLRAVGKADGQILMEIGRLQRIMVKATRTPLPLPPTALTIHARLDCS
jgi:hypothetical protein